MVNPLKQYLDSVKESPYHFSMRSKIRIATVYDVYNLKRRPYRKTVRLISCASGGKVSLKDYGYEDD